MVLERQTIKRLLKWFSLLILVVLVTPVLLLGGYMLWFEATKPRGTCLSVPFSADKAGNEISCNVKIFRTNLYRLDLRYDYADIDDRKKIIEVVGNHDTYKGEFKHPGAPISLQIIINDSSGQEVLNQTINNPRSGGFIPEWRQLYSGLIDKELNPGSYTITVRNLKDAAPMSTIPTHVAFIISNTTK